MYFHRLHNPDAWLAIWYESYSQASTDAFQLCKPRFHIDICTRVGGKVAAGGGVVPSKFDRRRFLIFGFRTPSFRCRGSRLNAKCMPRCRWIAFWAVGAWSQLTTDEVVSITQIALPHSSSDSGRNRNSKCNMWALGWSPVIGEILWYRGSPMKRSWKVKARLF